MRSYDLKVVQYEVRNRVATITLARPERLNAWTGRMHHEYRWAMAEANDDPDVRVIIVTGAGHGFCAGADSAALEGHVERGGYDAGLPEDRPDPGYGVLPDFDHDFAFQLALDKPIIAAINGAAAGVGFVLACYCDLRFAAAGAKLTTAHGKLHLPPEFGLSWLLPRLVGVSHAMDLLLSSRVVMAGEALTMGLVNRVEDDDYLLTATRELAEKLATQISPGSLLATKRMVYLDLLRDLGVSIGEATERLERMMTEPEFAEGVRALRDKRPPAF
jgi:enoyl-CoA hydratase/carnithine racemase